MKELDFDELDRAVNTLMSDVPKTPAPQPSDDDGMTTLDIPTTIHDDQPVPAFAAPSEPSTPAVVASPSTPMPAARRGGRFMDVVHPSSDMRTAAVPPRPVTRQGVTITPSSSPQPLEPIVQTPVVDEAPATPAAATEPQAWPDPLEMVGYQREPDTTTTTSAAEPETPDIIREVPAEESIEPVVAVSEPVEEQPLSTPFLSDAKVEKRPLGTNSTEELDHAPVNNTAASEDETPNAEDQLPATPEPTSTVLPAELQTDVLSIESDAPVETTSDASAEPRDEISDNNESTAAPEAATVAGPTSIQQQYTEQPSTGDQTTGGIYDTDSYHQPLAHPAKKKSGWMWVIWVVILLILGAAGGAIAYLYLLK